MDPEEAHRALTVYRKAQERPARQEIAISARKRRPKITKAKKPFLDAIVKIIDDLEEYWPLSVRQIHYKLLNDPPLIHASKPHSRYRNDLSSYKSADELLVRARFEGGVPFEAIHDKTRSVVTWGRHRSIGPFVREDLDNLFKDYYRDLQQSQPDHIEIVGEKNTIEGIIRPVANEYCIPYTIGRGYTSVPPRRAMANRFKRSGKNRLLILHLGDFDPEGEDIPSTFARSMRDDLKIRSVIAIKVGLTAEQVQELRLAPQMKTKERSSRTKKFVAKYGDDVYELEAAPPDWMQAQLRKTIDGVMDVDAYNGEIDAEKREAAQLDRVRRKIKAMLVQGNLLGEEGPEDTDDDF
jgi:hypothetical protein